MASTSGYSKRSSSVKRLLQEAKELAGESTNDGIHAAPFEENLYHWHFTIEGPKDSEFDGGLYHGRITLPPQYPFKAPDIMLLTPNGRFELNKKVCLTITGFHEESWQPAWGIRTALVGLSSFFTTEAKGAIGGLDAPASERKRLAALSRDWTCPGCQIKNCEILPPRSEDKKLENIVEDKPELKSAESSETVKPANSSSAENDIEAETPADSTGVNVSPGLAPATTGSNVTMLPQVANTIQRAPLNDSVQARPSRSDSMSRQEVEERHLQVVELLTRQLALNDPTSSVHHATSAAQSVAFAAPASNSGRGGTSPVTGPASAPPMWLDGAIGAVIVALASLIYRKVM